MILCHITRNREKGTAKWLTLKKKYNTHTHTHTQNIFDYVGQDRESTVDIKATSTKQHI